MGWVVTEILSDVAPLKVSHQESPLVINGVCVCAPVVAVCIRTGNAIDLQFTVFPQRAVERREGYPRSTKPYRTNQNELFVKKKVV